LYLHSSFQTFSHHSALMTIPRGKVEHLFKANETCSVLRAVNQQFLPGLR
jgi:hypothetical protein